MRDWMALKRPLAVAAVMGAGVLVQWALVSLDRAGLLVPPPEQVAEQFVKGLAEHNYGAARHALTRGLQAQVTESDLGALARGLRRRKPALDDAQGVSAEVRSRTASAVVEVRMEDGRRQELAFELEEENSLWKVRSIGPARALAAGGP